MNNFKLIVRKWYIPVLIISLITLVASAYALYCATIPETKETQISIRHYSALAYFSGGAEVKKDNPIWANGSFVTLPVYSYSLTPEYSGEFYFTTAPRGDITIETEAKIVYFYEVSDAPVWEKVYYAASNTSRGEIKTNFKINVTDLKSKINEAQNSFGVYLGKTGARIDVSVHYYGKITGKDVDETLSFKIPIDVQSTYYSFSTLNETRDFEMPSTRVVEVQKPLHMKVIPAALCTVSIIFAGLSVVYRTKYSDVSSLEREIERVSWEKKLKEVSFARMPETNLEMVEVERFEDISKAAEETFEHLFYDREKGVFFFIHGGVLYYCREK